MRHKEEPNESPPPFADKGSRTAGLPKATNNAPRRPSETPLSRAFTDHIPLNQGNMHPKRQKTTKSHPCTQTTVADNQHTRPKEERNESPPPFANKGADGWQQMGIKDEQNESSSPPVNQQQMRLKRERNESPPPPADEGSCGRRRVRRREERGGDKGSRSQQQLEIKEELNEGSIPFVGRRSSSQQQTRHKEERNDSSPPSADTGSASSTAVSATTPPQQPPETPLSRASTKHTPLNQIALNARRQKMARKRSRTQAVRATLESNPKKAAAPREVVPKDIVRRPVMHTGYTDGRLAERRLERIAWDPIQPPPLRGLPAEVTAAMRRKRARDAIRARRAESG
jgi:hypothetical protein